MLQINDVEAKEVLGMPECIEAMERAFAEEAKGVARNLPRARYKVPADLNAPGLFVNIIAGAVPSSGVAALRYDSSIARERVVSGKKRLEYLAVTGRSWGFVLVTSLETGEPLALIHDFGLSPVRVGATTGVAVRALSKKNSKAVGLFGSGNEARCNLEAICRVRKVERVKVYSPTRGHREKFAGEMSEELGLPIDPVGSAREVVEGSDIVMCATNSGEPVFDGSWLEPGQFVTTIANTDGVHRRTEADSVTMTRSDLIVLNSKETAVANQQRELLDLVDAGKVSWEKIKDLGELLIGKHPGRTSDRQIIYYKSNSGVGIQFAAVGALIYEACKRRGLGREIPAEWFGADVTEWLGQGFFPSP